MVYKIADLASNSVRTDLRGVTGCVDGSYGAETDTRRNLVSVSVRPVAAGRDTRDNDRRAADSGH